MDSKIDIKNLTFDEIKDKVLSFGGKPYTATQVYGWLYRKHASGFDDMTDVSKAVREKLKEEFEFKKYEPVEVKKSVDGTRKYLFRFDDGVTVESVYIPETRIDRDEDEEGASGEKVQSGAVGSRDNNAKKIRSDASGVSYNRRTLCVSSQGGCALDCKFCLTGFGGPGRNLKVSEMIAQFEGVARDVEKDGEPPITNVVLMGMGEPLHNYNEVVKFADVITGQDGYNLSVRKFTLSTAGFVPGIDKLGHDTNITLAVSLNATTDEVRDEIMPINKQFPIKALMESLKKFPLGKKRKITIEYVLLKGVNDSKEDAHRLAKILRVIPCKVNLIPFNKFPGAPYDKPSNNAIQSFKDIIHKAGYVVTVRESKGADILAACGQLVTAESTKS